MNLEIKNILEFTVSELSIAIKNIIEDNKNPYYWKELKNDIEIIDLNFLKIRGKMSYILP